MRTGLLRLLAVLILILAGNQAFAQLRAPTRPQVVMPDGPVRQIILKNCVACHGIDDYAFHALGREHWIELLATAHQGYELDSLSRRNRNVLLDYLEENFGTEHTPFPREYFPPEIDTYYDDDQGRGVLDTVCSECHALDRVYETRATIDRWRVLLLEMRARGAFLPDDIGMEQMAEWLSRVQSANTFE